MNLSRKHLPTFRTLFNLFMAGVVAFSFLLPVSEALAGPRRDDPPPDGSIPASDIPDWLDMSTSADQIYSEYPLETLAGKLILYGVTSAPDCPNGGLLDDSLASKCGVQAALPEVIKWQNRFNSAIIAASQQTGVPPVMLKNVFAWESQFWPNTVFVNTSEYGLGHLTEMGADSILRWNYAFYQSTCHDSFSSENCDKFYVDQSPAIQSALRGVVLQKVNADCSNCNYGLDLQKAEDSIPTFATTLLANQRLVKIYIQWFTGKKAADVVGDGDLWRFTLASYNAGPGCFKSALAKTYYAGKPINWETLSPNFDPACRGANAYVDFVSSNAQYFPDHAPSALPTPAATEVPLETITDAPTASATPEVTSTPEGTVSPTTESTDTQTVSPTATAETTPSVTATVTPTTELPSASPTLTIAETATSTVELPSDTPTATATETATPEPPTATPTPTPTEVIVGLPTEIPQGGDSSSELVVKFKDFPASLFSSLVLSSVGATVEQTMDPLGAVVVSVPDGQAAAVLDQLNNNLLVDYAEPNSSVQVFYTPNDPGFAQQSDALFAMQIPEVWDLTQGNGALVAVIDTGVDTIHADLSDALWTNPGETGLDAKDNDKRTNGIDDDHDGYVDDWQGWNFVDNKNHPGDDNGHGTHLAGIIAGRMDNNEGMAGIAPQAQVMALKALDANGHGTYANVAAAIYYAVDHGARIINLGFGGTDSSQALLDATNYAFDHGVLVIAAGGNTGDDTVFYPAANPNVMAVSALDGSLNPASFSSFNDNISLSAPGVNVFSTLPGSQYGPLSGTSMSAAEVSGVAALLAGLPKFDTTAAIREALIGGAFDLGNPGWDANYGYGLVHALDAINYVPGQTPTPTVSPTPDGTLTPTTTPGDGGVDIMAVAVGNAWTNIHATSPGNATGTVTSTGTFIAGAGTNRILLVGVICELANPAQAMTTLTATYGGVALTPFASTHRSANREHVWVGYLLDSQIPAGAQRVAVTYATGGPNLSSLDIKVATYTGVDQNTPFLGSSASLSATTTVANDATINYAVNGLTFYVAGNGGANATEVITANPTITEVSRTNSGSQTSFAGGSAVHAANGIYGLGGISITFATGTSNRSALVVGSLNPASIAATSPTLAVGNAWTNIHASTPNNQTGTVTSTGTFTAGAGTNRILLVGVICEINTAAQAMTTLTATYGTVALTPLASTYRSANREHVWVGYLLDSQIPAGAQRVAVTYNTGSGANTLNSLDIKVATYTGVDQNTPFLGSSASFSATTTVANDAAINYVANGLTFYVAGNGGTPATDTISSTPTLSEVNRNTSGSQTSSAGGSAIHGATSTYAFTGISIAFAGTTSAWSALVAGSLNPGSLPTLTSPTATSLTDTTATLGATITTQGSSAITARGTCWGTTAAPTTNCTAEGGTATGAFTQARTSLPAGTRIFYRGFATNSFGTSYSPDGSFYTEPASQASGVNFTAVGATSMTVNWTRGSGSGVIVLMKAASAVNSDPIDGTYTSYTANSAFGSGTQIGTGNYVIYMGPGTSVAVTGLTAGTTYYVAVYEYAGTVDTVGVDQGTNYKPSPAIGFQLINTPPVVTITTPANNSTYPKNTSITFTGTANDVPDGDISSGLVWYSNLTGLIGTGASITTSSLLPGTHVITAKSTDSNGESSSVSITVTVTPLKGPHGDFTATTDQCALCHRDHSAQGAGYLTTDPNSVTTSDTFCLNCHPGVSTHSNTNWGSAVEPHFEIRCIQCHDPHGNSNLFAVNTGIVTNLSASTVVSPVTFTAMTGSNSFDDGTSSNRLCVVCHTATTNHSGGASHYDSTTSTYTLDYTGQSCVACHPHNADTSAATLDGFMPIRNSNP